MKRHIIVAPNAVMCRLVFDVLRHRHEINKNDLYPFSTADIRLRGIASNDLIVHLYDPLSASVSYKHHKHTFQSIRMLRTFGAEIIHHNELELFGVNRYGTDAS